MINTYSDLLKEMKKQNLVRSKNVVEDSGEYIVIDPYRVRPKFCVNSKQQ